MANINRVTITGNLTRDPDLRSLPSGMAVCELGVAVNHRRKDNATDQWIEEPNFFNVVVFGAQGENCAQYLSKGRPVAVDGRLRWSSWEDKNGGGKRSKVEIVARRRPVPRRSRRRQPGRRRPAAAGAAEPGLRELRRPCRHLRLRRSRRRPGSGGGADDDIPF